MCKKYNTFIFVQAWTDLKKYFSCIVLETADALVISFGYQTVHVMPVLDGKLQTRFTRRVNIGGFQVDNFMQRLLQLKYPSHLNNITLSRAEASKYYPHVCDLDNRLLRMSTETFW